MSLSPEKLPVVQRIKFGLDQDLRLGNIDSQRD
jgi:GDP-D-mannose dehydratase